MKKLSGISCGLTRLVSVYLPISIAEAYLDLNDCTKATNALEQAFTYEYEYYGEENCRKYWLYDIKSKILEKQGKNDEAAEYRRWSEEEYKKYIQSRET